MMLNEFFSSLARARKRQIGDLGSREEGQASESHLPETLRAFGMSRRACARDRIPQRGEEQWGVPGEEETLGPLSFPLDLDPWVGVHRAPPSLPGAAVLFLAQRTLFSPGLLDGGGVWVLDCVRKAALASSLPVLTRTSFPIGAACHDLYTNMVCLIVAVWAWNNFN